MTLDLFGNEISTNAANAFNAGMKGRYHEDKLTDDHVLADSTYPVLRLRDGAIVQEDVPALSALNMRLRDDFVDDANAGVTRWNRVLERAGLEFRLRLPHVAFNRRIGEFAAIHADADGHLLTEQQWQSRRDAMLPTADDNRFVESLMQPVQTPGALRFVDRTAARRHRQQAGRLRVREDRGGMVPPPNDSSRIIRSGMVDEFGDILVTAEEIVEFASRYDPQTMHVMRRRRQVVWGLIASGWHTAAMTMRLFVEHYLSKVATLPSPGIDELRWVRPVRPGDRLRVRVTVVEARRSRSKPDRGIVRSLVEVLNQNGEAVMSMRPMNLMRCRTPG